MNQFISRHEYKHDLFHFDMKRIVDLVERDYIEIKRPYDTTLTLYFYHPEKAAPEVDTTLRLRAYTTLDIDKISMPELLSLHWKVERKQSDGKTELGDLDHLEEQSNDHQEALSILQGTHVLNLVKVVKRRHFSIATTADETHRITIDYSRMLYKVVDERLEFLGDLGPRIEVKLPTADSEEHYPLIQAIAPCAFWLPFGAFELYMQYHMHKKVPAHSYLDYPEIEVKHTITCKDADATFDRLHSWLENNNQGWQMLLPYPHVFSRVRRYHLCRGGEAGCQYTVVETRAGRCSLKTKKAGESVGDALLRQTAASHTTDREADVCHPEAFMQRYKLHHLNTFRKAQLKIPVVMANGRVFQFSVDECVSTDGRKLNQIEIEHAGSLDGAAAAVEQIINEIEQVSSALEASPVGKDISSTHISKYEYFT